LGDLNGDNRPDVAVGRSSNDIVTVFQNITTGPIAFAPGIDHFIGDGPYEGLIATDIDGDERPDLVASNFNGATVAVLKNISKKDIAFESAVQFPAAANATTVTSGDLDGDSRPDIVSANGNSYTGGNSITLLKNKTEYEVSFAPKLEYTAGTNPNDVLIADLDGDGKPEVIVVSVNTNSVTIFRNKMNEARVVPSGSNPVNGNIVCSITIDPVVQTHNGNPYVQRHYDIQPVNNPALSTATITLFFSQEDFDNYNIHPAHGANLPSGPDDVANKANVRAYQYHGFSASGMPGTYSGNGVEINPDDNNIVWNATAQWWEITFNIDGFSGFFLASAGSSILPLKLISFSGSLNGDNTILKWTTAQEMNVDRFELEHATNGADFTKISTIRAVGNSTIQANYQFTDHPRHNIVDYYRLRMIDQDDKFTYSYVIRVKKNQIENSSVVRIYPNPASSYLIVEHPSTNKTSELRIIDRIGTIVSLTAVGRLSKQTRVELEKLPSGHYQLVWTDGFRKLITTFVKH
jgi:hypothetical protein